MSSLMREVLPSAYSMIMSNRSIGYTMESAIADIIDNSISAGATIIDIQTPPHSSEIICFICDNGHGMDLVELDNAMTFGGKDYIAERKATDLGRFGLGLKTASLSQCRKFSVISKRKEEDLVGGFWDLDSVKFHNQWQYETISSEICSEKIMNTPLEEYESGTLVIWEKFDKLRETTKDRLFSEFIKEMASTQSHLELVFHRYLAGEVGLNKIIIRYNNYPLVPNDPFLVGKNPSVVEPTIINSEGHQIKIISHKLLHPSKLTPEEMSRLQIKGTLMNTQGFYVYRNSRLLIWGTWFGMAHRTDRTKLARIQIDVPNTSDHLWSLDIKKSKALPPSFLKPQLQNIIENVSNISIRTYRGRVKIKKNIVPFWSRTVIEEKYVKYEINRKNPLIELLFSQLDKRQMDLFEKLITNLELHLPIAQLHLDLQHDTSITNEIESENYNSNELQVLLNFFVEMGISKDKILHMEPFCNNQEFIKLNKGS